MKLGIFARTFPRPSLEGVLDAVVKCGLTEVQFNLACAGIAPLPQRIEESLLSRIGNGFRLRGLNMAAVSGTFNMIHPDTDVRATGLSGLQVLADAAPNLGTGVITL